MINSQVNENFYFYIMDTISINILLADDDNDDCLFFKEALEELPISTKLTTVSDGNQLMQLLHKLDALPHVLFLDLNMPRKNGYECLSEIQFNPSLNKLPIIILSTSFDKDSVNQLHDYGAHYYIRKPGEFAELKNVIHKALSTIEKNNFAKPTKDKFVLSI